MRIAKKALLLAVQRGVNVVDAFSTDLYTGNGSTQTTTNGIDLAGKGGLVWQKNRDQVIGHVLTDSVRGITKFLRSETTDSEGSTTSNITSLNSDGFSIATAYNSSGINYASWTFRQAPKFFDIVQYTGDGVAGRQIAHDLGVAPGMIVVKRLDGADNWYVWHRQGNNGIDGNARAALNDSGQFTSPDDGTVWGDGSSYIQPSKSEFTTRGVNNASGGSYIAYLFAHDPSDSGIIQCGSYVGNGSTNGPVIDLGWEPQWLLVKRTDSTGDWFIHDYKRDTVNPRNVYLKPNTSDAEAAGRDIDFAATGFQPKTTDVNVNASGGTYIYCAIKAPE